jgi:hypothetical protein
MSALRQTCEAGVALRGHDPDPAKLAGASRKPTRAALALYLERTTGLEPATYGLGSHAESGDEVRHTTTNAVNHAGLSRFAAARPAWLRRVVFRRLWHVCGTGGAPLVEPI